MKKTAIAVVVFAFAAGITSQAQDMVEYSHAAVRAPVAVQGLTNKINGALQKPAAPGGSGPQVQTVQTPKAGAPAESVPKPMAPALFIFADGKQLESSHYMVTAQNVVIEDGPNPKTIPLSALNREATIAANQQRGVSLKFPNSPSQMTISF